MAKLIAEHIDNYYALIVDMVLSVTSNSIQIQLQLALGHHLALGDGIIDCALWS